MAVNYSDQNLLHHSRRLQDASEGRLEIREQRRAAERRRAYLRGDNPNSFSPDASVNNNLDNLIRIYPNVVMISFGFFAAAFS